MKLEIPLSNCKVELKLRWMKHCIVSSAGVENDNPNSNNIIFTIEDTKLFVPIVTLSPKDNQKLSRLLSRRFGRSVYWNDYKTKSENQNTTNRYKYFLESKFIGANRLFVLVYSNTDDNGQKNIKLENIIYQKVLLRIMTSSSMEKASITNLLILI